MSEPTHTPQSCARAWNLLRTAHNAVANRLEVALAEGCALSIHEFDALLHLTLQDPEPVRVLDLLGPVPLSQPALSRLVTRLADRGLVIRSASEEDGRIVLLSLSEGGRRIASEAIAIHAHVVSESLVGRLDQKEQAALLELLGRIGGR